MPKPKRKRKDNRGEPAAKPETAEDPNKPIQVLRAKHPKYGAFTVRVYGAHVDVDAASADYVQDVLQSAVKALGSDPAIELEIVT